MFTFTATIAGETFEDAGLFEIAAKEWRKAGSDARKTYGVAPTRGEAETLVRSTRTPWKRPADRKELHTASTWEVGSWVTFTIAAGLSVVGQVISLADVRGWVWVAYGDSEHTDIVAVNVKRGYVQNTPHGFHSFGEVVSVSPYAAETVEEPLPLADDEISETVPSEAVVEQDSDAAVMAGVERAIEAVSDVGPTVEEIMPLLGGDPWGQAAESARPNCVRGCERANPAHTGACMRNPNDARLDRGESETQQDKRGGSALQAMHVIETAAHVAVVDGKAGVGLIIPTVPDVRLDGMSLADVDWSGMVSRLIHEHGWSVLPERDETGDLPTYVEHGERVATVIYPCLASEEDPDLLAWMELRARASVLLAQVC